VQLSAVCRGRNRVERGGVWRLDDSECEHLVHASSTPLPTTPHLTASVGFCLTVSRLVRSRDSDRSCISGRSFPVRLRELILNHAREHVSSAPGRWLLPLCLLHALVTLLQHWIYWRQLPERVATHFGWGGVPNDWMDRTSATIVLAGFQLVFPLLLLSVVRLLKWMPSGLINIPHREYWLATERREESLAWLQGPMSGVAGLTAALMAATSHLTFRANMRAGGLEEVPFFVCLSIYLAGTFWLVFRILRRFGTVPVPSGENMASG